MLAVPETQAAIWMNHFTLPGVSVVSRQVAIYFVSGNSLVSNTKVKKITPFLLHSAVPAPLAVSLAPQHHHQECDATQCSVTALSVAQHRVTQRGDQLGGSADLAWDCPSLWALLQNLL